MTVDTLREEHAKMRAKLADREDFAAYAEGLPDLVDGILTVLDRTRRYDEEGREWID